MTQSTSPNWERNHKPELQPQESQAEEPTLEFHRVLEMDHRSLLHDTITRASNRGMRSHLLDHHGNQEDQWKEVTKDHQSTQEVLMFTLTKIKYSNLKTTTPDHQVIKKMHQQAFLQDHRSEGIKASTPQSNITTNTGNQLLRLLRPASAKPMTLDNTIYLASMKVLTTINMSLNHTGPDSGTGNKWKALE